LFGVDATLKHVTRKELAFMSDYDLLGDTNYTHYRRRRRRRNFFEAQPPIQADGPDPVVQVGQRLREVRIERGLTIRDLAKESGLNVNTLSMIENGKNSPSLGTLRQLSFALQTPISAFFEASTSRNSIAYYKSGQRPGVAFAHGRLEDLGAGIPRHEVESFLVTLKPHSNSGENLIVHTGLEIVYCLEGQLTYTIDNQTFLLEPGDSLFFEAYLPHRWQNTGTTPTRSLLVLCPSDEQDNPTERHFSPQTAPIHVE
jgi:transcriptional regulator with XRE-family HTH domain